MNFFVSEYLCGGAWPESELPASLAREGRAMLQAVVSDLAGLNNLPDHSIEVYTTWDRRADACPFENVTHVHVIQVDDPQSEWITAIDLAERCDRTMVIAPEFDDILAARVEGLELTTANSANSTVEAIRLCADKLRVDEWCQARSLPTIPTVLLSEPIPWEDIVIKRRDGAGSIDMRRVLKSEIDDISDQNPGQWIAQPYVSGKTFSVGCFFDCGKVTQRLFCFEQLLSGDGRFEYQGGRTLNDPQLEQLARRVIEQIAIPGLHGYVGFDFIQPTNDPDQILLVEINPRLTTSYVGYRVAWHDLRFPAVGLLGAHDQFPQRDRDVQFTCDGNVHELLTEC